MSGDVAGLQRDAVHTGSQMHQAFEGFLNDCHGVAIAPHRVGKAGGGVGDVTTQQNLASAVLLPSGAWRRVTDGGVRSTLTVTDAVA